MSQKFRATIAVFCLCLLAAFTMAQSKQPNLTGTWKMNAEKTKFEQGGPNAITIKFDHKDTMLSETLMLTHGNGDSTIETKYSTDGKETAQEVIGGRKAQTSAKWEGETLTIAWKTEDGDFIRKITLSADGKTMTMVVNQSGATDIIVLEKQ